MLIKMPEYGKKWLEEEDRKKLRTKGTIFDSELGDEYRKIWEEQEWKRQKQSHLQTISSLPLKKLNIIQVNKKTAKKWKEYCDAYHYVPHSKKSVKPYGRFLRYFIECDNVLVGIIAICGAFIAIGDRDAYIGWNKEQRLRNNKNMANNLVFCIFPNIKVKNLGSFILSKFVKRAKKDWEARYTDKLVLMETLVDLSRFSGVTYQAAGWINVGKTKGFGFKAVRKTKNGYGSKNMARVVFKHNIPKLIFIKPLAKNWREELFK